MHTTSNNIKPIYYIAFFIFLLFILLIHNNNISVWDQDEAAYGLFAKNMLETKNWTIPNAMWSEIHRKPPLHFWNVALSFKLFGVNEFALRFPSVLFTILNFILILWAGGKLFGNKLAFITALILSTTILIPLLAKVSLVDATLLFFITLCAFSILFILLHRSKITVLFFWTSFALALLTKGPPVIIFTMLFTVILFLFHPNRKNLILLHPWFFLPLSSAPFAYWCYTTMLQDGGLFLNWMYDWYILKRINGSVLGQTAIPGAHLLFILLCFFSYVLFIPNSFYTTVKHFFKDKNYSLLIVAWFFSGWFIYELSPSKLPTYVVSAHIPLAFLIAKAFINGKMPANISLILHFFIQMIIASLFIAVTFYFTLPNQVNLMFLCVGIILIICTSISLFLLKTKLFIYGTIGYGLIFQIILCAVLLPQIDTLKDCTKRMSNYLIKNNTENSNVLIGNSRWSPPSLPFYLSSKFSQIKEEHRFTELVASYCCDTNSILILNKRQFVLMDSLLLNVNRSTTKFNNEAILPSLVNEYYVVENSNKGNYDSIKKIDVAPPHPPFTIKAYETQIRKSPEFMIEINKKAKLNGISTEEMIIKDAIWLFENATAVYNYDKRMRNNQKWLELMQKKALRNQIKLEEMCFLSASFVVNSGNID
jgi:4-amino-4-deoxy-L-arabinose transferase-like glycosyltransferase